MTARVRRGGRGTLTIIALFLAASAALRVGAGVGQALAGSPEEGPQDHAVMAEPLTCPEPPAALAEALRTRATELSARETALEDRLAALALAEEAITERLAAMEAAEAELSETLALADGAAEEDLARLTAVYETMKPKDAAALFESMDPDFAAGFFGRMRPDAAAAIMSSMSSEAAYGISVILAGRNALVPKE